MSCKPHGGLRPFHQKSTCITQSTFGPCVVQIWSRTSLELRGDETLVVHRAAGFGFGFWVPGFGFRVQISGSGFRDSSGVDDQSCAAASVPSCTNRYSFQFENNYCTEMCSGSEAGSYVRLIDFVHLATLGLRVIKKKKKKKSLRTTGSGFALRIPGPRFRVPGLNPKQGYLSHTVDCDPFIKGQLASRNQLSGLVWCKFGHATAWN